MARGQVGNENIESRKKTITIRLRPASATATKVLLLGAVLLVVGLIGAVTLRITRQ